MENTAISILSRMLKQPGKAAWIDEEISALPKAQRENLIKRLLQLPDLPLEEIATGGNGRNPFINGRVIMTTDWPEIIWAVPGIIPAGLTIFAGKSKLGKSWFMMQVAFAVATGGQFLDRPIEQGKVLYLALEDSERRIKSRMKIQGWTAVLCYPSAEVCNTRIRVYCLEPGQPSPAVGDWYERTGNQKFELRGYQTLRWYETIEHRWYAYLPSLRKCPPCPDCYDGAPIE